MILLSSEAVSDVERVRSFLERLNPDAAKRALKRIWDALEMVEKLPSLGRPTEHPEIRQIVVLFGSSGYIVRYKFLHEQGTLPGHAHLAQSRGAGIGMAGMPTAGSVHDDQKRA